MLMKEITHGNRMANYAAGSVLQNGREAVLRKDIELLYKDVIGSVTCCWTSGWTGLFIERD